MELTEMDFHPYNDLSNAKPEITLSCGCQICPSCFVMYYNKLSSQQLPESNLNPIKFSDILCPFNQEKC